MNGDFEPSRPEGVDRLGGSNQAVADAVLGLDSSCYTTSCAVVDMDGVTVARGSVRVPVRRGELGARQSFAVFSHVTNLPDVIEQVIGDARRRGEIRLCAVAASTRPLPEDTSYLPVFRVSGGFGRALASCLGVPFVEVSHQVGHLMVAWPLERWLPGGPESALALHLSGGTTQLLELSRVAEGGGSAKWVVAVLGDSADIHAGQLVDRVGARIGLPFPAGRQLDELARACKGAAEGGGGVTQTMPPAEVAGRLRLPSAVRGYDLSFSGACSMAERALDAGVCPAEVARAVFDCIAKSCEKIIRKAMESRSCPGTDVLVVGGVAASSALRARMTQRLEHPAVGATLWFPDPALCEDNSVGVALAGVAYMRFGLKFIPGTKEIHGAPSK